MNEHIPTILQYGFNCGVSILTNKGCKDITNGCIDVFPFIIIESVRHVPFHHTSMNGQLEHELSVQSLP